MKDGFIKIAAATPVIRVADPEANAQAVIRQLDEAWEQGARIIVFPELVLTGYTCSDLFLQDTLLAGADKALRQIRKHTKEQDIDAVVLVGLPFQRDGKLYNVAALIHRGEVLAMIPKQHLPNHAEFYEARIFTPGKRGSEMDDNVQFHGDEPVFGANYVFDMNETMPGLMLGVEICEDAWVPNPPNIDLAMAGATIIVNLSASDEVVGKDTYRRSLITSTSARTISGYVYACAGPGESTTDVVFGGHSMIAENGTLLAEQNPLAGEETSISGNSSILYADIDVARLCYERRRTSTWNSIANGEQQFRTCVRNDEISMKAAPTRLTRVFDPKPFIPSGEAEREERCEQILRIQTRGLATRLKHTGIQSAVVGVSGGLDSTLALLVTVRAFDELGLDRKGILAVTMPCFGTTERTHDNAKSMAKALGVSFKEVDIEAAVRQHFKDIGQDGRKHDVTYENSQARERTQVLMDLANRLNGLVVGTGDLSELALGWATYNGDHMSMYGVNAGVPKTLVRHLVSYLAVKSEDRKLRSVLMDVLDTPVSPELLPPKAGKISQQTEELVGPYELHDFFLYYMMRCGIPPAKIYRIAVQTIDGTYDAETILKWLKVFYRRFFTQQFKRSCLPDGPKIGSVSLSPRGDWRMPSDASAALWLKELESLS